MGSNSCLDTRPIPAPQSTHNDEGIDLSNTAATALPYPAHSYNKLVQYLLPTVK